MDRYLSRAARDAQASGIGDSNYWDYLDQSAIEHQYYWLMQGNKERADLMLTQSLGDALAGNDGE